jgi:hypothetical protein
MGKRKNQVLLPRETSRIPRIESKKESHLCLKIQEVNEERQKTKKEVIENHSNQKEGRVIAPTLPLLELALLLDQEERNVKNNETDVVIQKHVLPNRYMFFFLRKLINRTIAHNSIVLLKLSTSKARSRLSFYETSILEC